MSETPRIEVTVAAPADEVWSALRDRDRIRHWHGWDADGLDEEIEVIYFKGFTADAATYTLDSEGDTIRLYPGGDRTRVVLTRGARGTNPEWDEYYDDITEGWTTFLHQLRFAVERHPGDVRRTVFLSGPAAPSPIERLGLGGLAEHESYAADLAGEQVSGQVWYRSEHQVGVTVDAWGNGLLILGVTGPSQVHPEGAAMAVLSTYGLGDAAYEVLERRWTRWWRGDDPA